MVDIQNLYNIVQRESYIFVDVSIFTFHDIFACEVVDFSCFILQQENFTSYMKISEV